MRQVCNSSRANRYVVSVIVSLQSKLTYMVYKSKNHMKTGYHKLIFSDRLYTVVCNIWASAEPELQIPNADCRDDVMRDVMAF
jgi:hypothetical protein